MSAELGDLRSSILEQFGSENVDPRVVEKCKAICDKFDRNLKEFQLHLDAFILNSSHSAMTIDNIGEFESQVYKETQKERINPPRPSLQAASPSSTAGMKRPANQMTTPSGQDKAATAQKLAVKDESPVTIASSQSPATFSGSAFSVNTYKDRKNSGSNVVKSNPELGERGPFEMSDVRPFGTRARLTTDDADFENITQRYRFMFTAMEERARTLDRQLLKLQTDMTEKLMISELQPVGIPSQDKVWVCGRICCESSEGKINSSSVLLEGDRAFSRGRRTRLEIQNLQQYALFPGQIVLVEGINSSGRSMVATNIIEGLPKPLPRTTPQKLLEYHTSTYYQGGKAVNIMVAAGPFTTSENLLYEPFRDLLERVLDIKPDLLVLLGPFVDLTQPLLNKPDVRLAVMDDDGNEERVYEAASYEMVFRLQIVTDGLNQLFDADPELPTQIVMLPSLNDGFQECVFPQPPIGDRKKMDSDFFEEPLGELQIPFSTDKNKRVHLLPNPCMFRFNEVLFGVCSNDTLFSLSADETSKNTGNRLARLAGHLLQQQSFAPIFPVPTSGFHQADLRHARHWQLPSVSPDVLITPSKLQHMAKDVLGTLVLNPGSLAKGVNGGTYAEMSIHPMKEGDLRKAIAEGRDQEPIEHGVFARTNVNIQRI